MHTTEAPAPKARKWLTDSLRSEFARRFACEPSEVESHLDARDAMNAYAAERREREGGPALGGW